MKITTLPILGVLSFALAGCIARDNTCDCDKSSSSDAVSESSVAVSSSSEPAVSSSSEVVVSSSSVMSSSSSVVIVPSSSSVASSSSVMSSSSVASSSTPMVNIEDLAFTTELKDNQSITTDSIANLGTALLGLIDKDALDEFYLSLVAQGLDQAAVARTAKVMAPIGTAIGADFVERIAGSAVAGLLPKPEGIQLVALETAIGRRGAEYSYVVKQTIDGVAVDLDIALRFEVQKPSASALGEGRNGYEVYLDGIELIVNNLTLTSADATITINNTDGAAFSTEYLTADVELLADGSNIKAVTLNGELASLNLGGSAITGAVGVTAEGTGTIGFLNVDVDMETGNSELTVTTPDVSVNMQGVDTSN